MISNEYRMLTGIKQFQGIYNVMGLFYRIRMKVYVIDLQPRKVTLFDLQSTHEGTFVGYKTNPGS